MLLHGFGGSHRVWASIQDALCEHATVIAYDLPGHGASLSWADAGAAKVAVRAVVEDLSSRGLSKVHLVGHSMGGAVATLIASGEPARAVSLTLLAPGGFGPEINGRLLARYAAARSEADIRAALEAMTGFEHPVSEEAVRDSVTLREAPGQVEKLVEMGGMMSRNGKQGAIPREWLEKLSMPVSIIWGKLDGVLPFHQTDDLPAQFAFHRLASAGHMLIEEAPELVVQVIRRQLALDPA